MTLLRFSTEGIPSDARKAAVESIVAPHSEIGVDFLRDWPFSVSFGMRALPETQVMISDTSAFKCRNTPADDSFLLIIGQRGVGAIEHDSGPRFEIGPGAACLAPIERSWTSLAHAASSILSLTLPRTLLERGQMRLDTFKHGHLPESQAIHLLQTYAATLLREDLEISTVEAARFALHIQDLALLALGSERRDETERARRRGMRSARLADIKADVQASLRDPDLSLDWLAGRHRLSARTIRGLFYGEGTSFTDYVLGARLDRVRDLLMDADKRDRTITTLVFETGFGDLSWFYQAFRRRFGMAPSEMREMALMRDLRD